MTRFAELLRLPRKTEFDQSSPPGLVLRRTPRWLQDASSPKWWERMETRLHARMASLSPSPGGSRRLFLENLAIHGRCKWLDSSETGGNGPSGPGVTLAKKRSLRSSSPWGLSVKALGNSQGLEGGSPRRSGGKRAWRRRSSGGRPAPAAGACPVGVPPPSLAPRCASAWFCLLGFSG